MAFDIDLVYQHFGLDMDDATKVSILNNIQRGTALNITSIDRRIINTFALRLDNRHDAKCLLENAVELIFSTQDAGNNYKSWLLMISSTLPLIELTGSSRYWDQVFAQACISGPRAVGALLLAAPPDVINDAREENTRLLLKLIGRFN